MDKETRGAIERATQRARRLLETDLGEQLEGTYDVLQSGETPPRAGERLDGQGRRVRERILASVAHKVAGGLSSAEAVEDYLRDAAFTTLNRFVALKMLEARELVQECVTKGEESSGYRREFCGAAPGVALLPNGEGYRLYLECLFDELSTEVKVLFDRRDPASAVWPRRQCLGELLGLLNDPELAQVWREDETIGWVYQYFNSPEKRGEMRNESQAPQDSRELAVRNQFFTPRYVVEFLTDNTLGRIWFEMQGGRTALIERCRYLIRRAGETWPPRSKKDPRDLRILDPACGSGHFLLYAFDLLLAIYEEAWADPESPPARETGRRLQEDFQDLEALRRALPGLILRHNLHGVDIDPRCAQIAQLALWMRAQRAFQELGLPRGERPPIRRGNIVVAEPMPGDPELRNELLARLGDPALAALYDELAKELKFAADMGLLLHLEDLLRPGSRHLPERPMFASVEASLRGALEALCEGSEGRQRTTRRLFAEDALAGLGLLELAEKRYDAVVMNPPFGDPTPAGRKARCPDLADARNDLGAAFVLAARRRWGGRLGVLASTALWFKPTAADWRREALLSDDHAIQLALHLGGEVLDGATVSASALVIDTRQDATPALFFRLLREPEKDRRLDELVRRVTEGRESKLLCTVDVRAFRDYRGCPLAYWISQRLRDGLRDFPALEGRAAEVRVGVQVSDDPRFVRAWWEVDRARIGMGQEWVPLAKSSEYSPFWDDITWVVRWVRDGREVRAFDRSRPQNTGYFGRAGVTYPALAVLGFNPRAFPPGCGFGHKGSVAFPSTATPGALLGYLASRPLEYVLSFSNGSLQGRKGAYPNHFEVGQIKDLPWPDPSSADVQTLDALGSTICTHALHLEDESEITHQYNGRPGLHTMPSLRHAMEATIRKRHALVAEVGRLRGELDLLAARLLRFEPEDVEEMRREFAECDAPTTGPWSPSYLRSAEAQLPAEARDLLSELFGMAMGRIDIRFAAGLLDRPATERNALDPLPSGSPALLAGETPAGYPLDLPHDGILVDDPGHSRDLEKALRSVASVIWREADAQRMDELAELLQVRTLREYLRSELLADHLKRYSKSRRKAPIYWQLSIPSARYSFWFYIHAFTRLTLDTVLQDYVDPKLDLEERELVRLRAGAGPTPTLAKQKELERQESFVDELRALREEFARVAPLWDPNLDDGVVINFAILWRLVPQNKPWQKECKAIWDGLCAGEYDWAHLAMRLWPERVVHKCAADRSLAIAHGLEQELWIEDGGKWKPRDLPKRRLEALVGERSSAAVSAALNSLLEAPMVSGKKKPPRGRKAKSSA